jgi:hypothetical protein
MYMRNAPVGVSGVLQTLSTALDALQQRLTNTGLQDQAAAVASGRENVTSKVHEAADAVASFVKVRMLWQLHAVSASVWCWLSPGLLALRLLRASVVAVVVVIPSLMRMCCGWLIAAV